jgi:hypothetical protein
VPILPVLVLMLPLSGSVACTVGSDPEEDDWFEGEMRSASSTSALPAAYVAQLGPERAPCRDGVCSFGLLLPLGVIRTRVALVASDSLLVGPNTSLVEVDRKTGATVVGVGRVDVGSSSVIGPIYGRAVRLDSNVDVRGYVSASVPIEKAPSAGVRFGTLESAPGGTEWTSWTIAFPRANAGPIRTFGVMPIAVGAYSRLTVADGSSAVLRAGSYYFDALDVSSKGILELDNTLGPVYVWIRDALAIRGPMIQHALVPRIVFGYAGSAPVVLASGFRGTLLAPHASLTLEHTETPHMGSFFAANIQTAPNASVIHTPFLPGVADDYDPVGEFEDSGDYWMNSLGI